MKNVLIGLLLIIAVIIAIFVYQFFQYQGSPYTYADDQVSTSTQSVSNNYSIQDAEVGVNVRSEKVREECVLLEDFSSDSELRWGTVNDGVMGGLSDGVTTVDLGLLTHSGFLNTNGGGFSYTGSQLPESALEGYSSLYVRLNTNGRQYAVNFSDSRYRSISHQVQIPVSSDWQEVEIAFSDTVPTFFGRQTNSDPFDPSAIDELNFILSDGIDGPFEMKVDFIELCL